MLQPAGAVGFIISIGGIKARATDEVGAVPELQAREVMRGKFCQAKPLPEAALDRHAVPLAVNAGDSELYRLTLLVGTQSLTRPYLHQNDEC